MRKILYISGTRADYGLMRSVLFSIDKHQKLKLEIIACGMHMMREFGYSFNEIKKDGFKVHKINIRYKEDDRASMSLFIGQLIIRLTKTIKKLKPDIILLLGDRGEMLAGAIAGQYLGIPVAQLHGGEITSTVDEAARHAITKLANIHFPATRESADRIIKMGEDKNNVFIVGAPGLDQIINTKLKSKKEILRNYSLKDPFLLVLQHPVSFEFKKSAYQIRQTLEAIKKIKIDSIVVYPNSDAGGRSMIKVIEKYRKYPFVHIFKNINHEDFLSLMKYSSVMVGNSSSGIIEASSFCLPVVNIGTRQEDRQRSGNIIDVHNKKNDIIKAIKKAMTDKKFKAKIKKCKNPYGDGKTGKRVAEKLSNIRIDKKLVQKKMSY